MNKNERKLIMRLALVLAILLLIAVYLLVSQQFDQSYNAARNVLDNLPPAGGD